ncbi:MAG TPA: polymer-forming cytoskeletal protein [Terriglobales bacterium]|nr:polymer-forming cytoskeletal protein [Terriglobales bacterium]
MPKAPATPTKASSHRTSVPPTEQATLGRSLVIKGEVIGSEPLYIDGRVEGSIHLGGNRLTIGHHGSVEANVEAQEMVIMGSVKGNVQCSERLDIRTEGSLVGDVVSQRISIEEGAVLRGKVEVRAGAQKQQHPSSKAEDEKPKAAAASAGA